MHKCMCIQGHKYLLLFGILLNIFNKMTFIKLNNSHIIQSNNYKKTTIKSSKPQKFIQISNECKSGAFSMEGFMHIYIHTQIERTGQSSSGILDNKSNDNKTSVEFKSNNCTSTLSVKKNICRSTIEFRSNDYTSTLQYSV